MADAEIWRNIEGYEGYAVSNYGRIKSLERKVKIFRHGKYHERYIEEKILKLKLDKDGYYRIILRNGKEKKCLPVARLVAKAFIPNPDNLPCVNHKSEVKTENFAENLEWCSVQYNTNYGTVQKRRSKHLKKPIMQYTLEGEEICYWFSISDAAKETGFSAAAICQAAKGRIPHSNGFKWEYAA